MTVGRHDITQQCQMSVVHIWTIEWDHMVHFTLNCFPHRFDTQTLEKKTINTTNVSSQNISTIRTVVGVGHLYCVAWEPKFQILLPRSFVPQPVEYTHQVSSMSAQRSWSIRVLKMSTPHAHTDGHLSGFISHLGRHDIKTCDANNSLSITNCDGLCEYCAAKTKYRKNLHDVVCCGADRINILLWQHPHQWCTISLQNPFLNCFEFTVFSNDDPLLVIRRRQVHVHLDQQ